MQEKIYKLPELNYGFNDLSPYISEEQLKIHYQKHHQAYVSGANALLEKMAKARSENIDFDMKAALKEFSFNVSGHLLHSLFWENLSPKAKTVTEPSGKLKEAIEAEFNSFERFKKEFSQAAVSVEGSGWSLLSVCPETGRLVMNQIEKHSLNSYPGFNRILVLDVFEHAYYLDYKNERARFVEAFWNIVNWGEVSRRLEKTLV